MAIKQIGEYWVSETGLFRREFVMDSDADVANLPECGPGSVAIVAANGGGVYMVNASGEWGAL